MKKHYTIASENRSNKIKGILNVNINYLRSFNGKLQKLNVMRFKKLHVRFWIWFRTQVSVDKLHPIKTKLHTFKEHLKKKNRFPNNAQVISY